MANRFCARLSVLCALLGGQAIWASDIQFTTPNVGIDYNGAPGLHISCSASDVDGDGWVDVLITGDPTKGTRLYRNNHNKTFSDMTVLMLPPDVPNGSGAVLADMNNDGWPDLILARWYGGSAGDVGVSYYMNMAGCFMEEPMPTDFLRFHKSFGGMTVGDFNGDRWLDLMFLNNPGPGHVVASDGMGHLDDITSLFEPTINQSLQFWSAVVADFNGDHRPDVHVAVDHDKDIQWRNMGQGVFKDVSAEAGVLHVGSDMGLAVGDFENDGDLDIYSTNIGFHCLYVNNGSGVFADKAALYGCGSNGGALEMAWGAVFADFDNDTDLDLAYVAEGATGAVFENDGTGHYSDITDSAGAMPFYGTGLLTLDYDKDGDLDMLQAGWTSNPILYENVSTTTGRHWLQIAAHGTHGNREGVGAVAKVTAGSLNLIRPFMVADSYLTSHASDVFFGLGSATTVDVTVYWPTGAATVLNGVPADMRIVVDEPICGDVTHDGIVDLYDVTYVLLHLFQDNLGDINGDATTDLFDLNLTLLYFGQGC